MSSCTHANVLLDTTQMYYYFFNKNETVQLKRVIMILGASLEFDKKHNNELIKQLPSLGEKNKERPLCYYYSIKARALLFAQLSRLTLPPESLDEDRMYVVRKCPYLIQEMVSCVSQLIILAYAKRISRLPTVETIENCMKLCPMLVQALWENKSPLLQLPHIHEENLKWFSSKKRHIKSLQQFAQLSAEDRRAMLKSLSDDQYQDIMKVLRRMPYIDFQVKSEVIDDEEPTVYTAGAIVTVTVMLKRKDMGVLFGDQTAPDRTQANEETKPEDEDAGDEEKKEETNQAPKPPAWLKQKKGKKGGKKGSKKQGGGNKPVAAAANKKAVEKPAESESTAVKKSERTAESGTATGPEDSELSDDEAEHSDDSEETQTNEKVHSK
ncbi:hypothetical protein B566_EDAN004057 [Ephemera danica]|nr:hypothetical protein B566_EDAN004057 [Ephemera danica]